MIIDMHTHVYPEKIAKRAVEKLSKAADIPAQSNGMKSGLQESMKRAGVDYSLLLPVATSVKQVDKMNQEAVAANECAGETGLISFGAIHPDCENYKEIIDDIASMELKAIKLHPDYQHVFFDDERYIRLIDYAANKGLGIIVHAGEDVGLPDTIHCTPDMVLNLWKHIQPEKLILAHMGGWKMWDEVEEKLLGLPFYLDTAIVLNPIFPVKLENEQFVRMVRKHGADRILFGTDSPWYDQTKAVNDFNNTDLTQEEKDKIFGKNANDLFNFFG